MSDAQQVTEQEYARRRDLWADALVSGEFVQGRGKLKAAAEDNGERQHCCLGVACEIYRRETGIGSWQPGVMTAPDYSMFWIFVNEMDGSRMLDYSSAMLPEPVTRFFGVKSSSAHWDSDVTVRGTTGLVGANDKDHDNLSFAEIAALLREPPRGLFTWKSGGEK